MTSSEEQHELARIQHWLTVNDPDLAAALSAPGAAPVQANRRSVRLAVDLLGVLGIAAGTLTATFTLIFGGVLVLMAGACLHATCRRRSRRG
jgi:hypothetical protein